MIHSLHAILWLCKTYSFAQRNNVHTYKIMYIPNNISITVPIAEILNVKNARA